MAAALSPVTVAPPAVVVTWLRWHAAMNARQQTASSGKSKRRFILVLPCVTPAQRSSAVALQTGSKIQDSLLVGGAPLTGGLHPQREIESCGPEHFEWGCSMSSPSRFSGT